MDGARASRVAVPEDVRVWAQEEFGEAELGDARRTARLVAMAGLVATRGSANGRVTQAFERDADRQGAYGFLENREHGAAAALRAASVACARRVVDEEFVFVPVDGSSLNLGDRQGVRGLGPIGDNSTLARGLLVMTAIGLQADGTPAGLLGQVYWVRPNRPRRQQQRGRVRGKQARREQRMAKRKAHRRRRRSMKNKETRFWLDVVEQARAARDEAGTGTRLWFQLDRGADFHEMLRYAAESQDWFTIRAAQDRRTAQDQPVRRLWDAVERRPLLGRYRVVVPPAHGRKGREAEMEVRACRVELALPTPDRSVSQAVTLWAVLTRENGTTPPGEKPIEWLLLTNHPVETLADACLVIRGYTTRWRVEEFHKTWKSTCGVETTQLRTVQSIEKWATILASSAMRIERLKYLARTNPELPATAELSQEEVDATIVLRQPAGYRVGDTPSIALAVRWIADVGGYTGRSSGGPPGAIVIGRGLQRVEVATTVLRNIAKHKRRGKM